MKLYEALKQVIGDNGSALVKEAKLVNMLDDYHAFEDMPSSKYVLRTVITEGYGAKLLDIGQWNEQCEQIMRRFVSNTGVQNSVAEFIFWSLAYGLGWPVGDGEVEFTQDGGSREFTLFGNTARSPWDVEYSTDEGATYFPIAPDWLSLTTDAATSKAVATVQPLSPVNLNSDAGVEWCNIKGTKENPYNLSNASGAEKIENTANCYIINCPGWYKIPLVYGNAVKNGEPNPAAYTSNHGTFVDSDGNIISQPYIAKSYMAKSGSVIWQDVDKLITDIAVFGTGKNAFLSFRVAPAHFDHGNAVIAVEGGPNILWSWHIWVTDYELGKGDISYTSSGSDGDGKTREFMPYNLGWVGEKVVPITTLRSYVPRKCKVRFSIKDHGEADTQIVKEISQTPKPMPIIKEVTFGVGQGNNVYYQWGRKDPFPGGRGGCCWSADHVGKATATKKTFTDNTNLFKTWGIIFDQTTYAASIRSPGLFRIGNTVVWGGEMGVQRILRDGWHVRSWLYKDAWNSGFDGDDDKGKDSVKTIYDPCPVGYCVPNSYALMGLVSDLSPFFTGTRARYGVNLMPNFEHPFAADDKFDGSLLYVGERSCYWSSCYRYGSNCIVGGLCPEYERVKCDAADGRSIRAVREE